MNSLAILSRLILLWVSYTPIQGFDHVICDFSEVTIPPAPTYEFVKLWKSDTGNYYHFTRTKILFGGQPLDDPIYQGFTIHNVYSMVGRVVWLNTTDTEQSIIVTFLSIELAQQFYFYFNPVRLVHQNRFILTSIMIIPPSLNHYTIRDNLAIDVYVAQNPDGQNSVIRRIFIHGTQHDQAPLAIFYSTELVAEVGNSNTVSLAILPEKRNQLLACSIVVKFANDNDRQSFVGLHRRMPSLPQDTTPLQYIYIMRALQPTDGLRPTPASSAGENQPD